MAAFDWYQGTAKAGVDDVIGAVLGLSNGAFLAHSKGMHGYGTTTTIRAPEGPVGQVWHGGTHQYPHFVFSGEMAQPGAELIRAEFPEHQVSRSDVREDYDEEDAFDRMQPVLLDAARAHRVQVGTAGDHLLTKVGRTVYLGSPKSPCRMRMYDKAAELRAVFSADPVRLATVPEHRTRLELQVRPQTREAKQRFSSIEPQAVLGSCAWSRQVWRDVGGLELVPVRVTVPYRQADGARAYAYMLAQYGAVLRAQLEDLGDWACVGRQIGHDLAEFDRAKGTRLR